MEESDPKNKRAQQKTITERLRDSLFPHAAVLGAFTSFVAGATGSQAEKRAESPRPGSLVQINFPGISGKPSPPSLELQYSQTFVIGNSASKHPFRSSLLGIALNSEDRIFVLGDGEVRAFESNGDFIGSWKAPLGAQCLAVGPDNQIYFGLTGGVEIFGASGNRAGGFAVKENNQPANITAIKIIAGEILVADASARIIRRYDLQGRQTGNIGAQGKSRGFMLPNRSLDFDVNAGGVIFAADSGRHRVSSWTLSGSPVGHFGKFGQSNPQDFVGCCNPVGLAIAPDGKIVTAEKVITRVKVYDSSGKILAMIGPENFDPKCVRLYLAVDSRGRILAADPVRREVKVFSVLNKLGVSRNL
jgi:hypothetical protein